jgi:hypothetical protein
LLLQPDLDHLKGRHDQQRLGDARHETRTRAPQVCQLPVLVTQEALSGGGVGRYQGGAGINAAVALTDAHTSSAAACVS